MKKLSRPRHLLESGVAVAFLVSVFAKAWGSDESAYRFDLNGNLQSQAAAFTAPPQIIAPPQPQVVSPGELASFFVVAANTRDLTYQWCFHGTNVSGATGDALLLTNVSALDEGLYSVVLANGSGSVTSAPVMLWIDGDRDGLADAWELANFGSLTNNPTADFDGDGVSNLDEFHDGTAPTNNASAIFRLTILADGGKVEPFPAKLTYTNGEVVTLTATAFAPEVFHGWTGSAVSRTNPLPIVMSGNKTLFANFQPRTLTWAGGASGSWHEPTNWSPTLVPTQVDDVFMPNGINVALNEPAACRNLSFTNGTLTVAGGLTVHSNLTWAAGTLHVNQPMTVGGQMTWVNGTMNINQDVTLLGPTALMNGTWTGNQNLNVWGTMTWTGGTMSGSGRTVIESGAQLTISSVSGVNLTTRTLENRGTVVWAGAGNLNINNAVITNASGALFEIQNAATLGNNGGSPRVDNAGTVRKLGNSGTTTSFIAFNNHGTVDLQAGALDLKSTGNHTGSFLVPTDTLLQLSGTQTGSGSASITGEGRLTFGGGSGTVTWAGLVEVTGTNTFSGPVVTFNGTYVCTNNPLLVSSGTANFNSTGTIAPPLVQLTGGTLGGSTEVRVPNVMTWTGGTMSGSGRTVIESGAQLTISSVSGVNLTTRTLENRGTVVWAGAGNLNINNAVITNASGALFEIQNAATLGNNGGSPRVDNAGTVRKLGNSGTTTSFIAFNNHGTVDLQAGALDLKSTGNHTGSFLVPTDTLLQLSGTQTGSGSASITGEGRLTFGGGSGTVTWAGLVEVTGTNTFSGPVVTFNGTYVCTNNPLLVSSGTANFNSTGTIAPPLVQLTGGTLGGSTEVRVPNVMTWTGGTMSGSGRTVIESGAQLTISSVSGVNLTTRTLENRGTVVWAGAGNLNINNAVITNASGALFEIQNAATLGNNGGSPRVDNAGTVRKLGNSGTTTSFIAFNNHGTVDLQAGALDLKSTGNHTGSFLVPTDTLLQLSGTQTGSGSASITGEGRLTFGGGSGTVTWAGLVEVTGTNTFSGPVVTFNGTYVCTNNPLLVSSGTANFNSTGTIAPPLVQLTGGTLGGSTEVRVPNVMTWTGGTMSGNGRTVIESGAQLTINSAAGVNLTTRTLENRGTLVWAGAGNININNAVLTNGVGALFEIQNAATFGNNGGSPRVDNAGTVRKLGNSGTTTSFIAFNNYGNLDIRRGILALNGNFGSSTGSVLASGLGGTTAGTGYGQLQKSGTITLNGKLSVELLPGFTPATNDTFTVVTAGTRSGTFSSFTYPDNRVTMTLSNTPTSVVLRVGEIFPVPQPVLFTPELVNSNALLTWTATSNVTYRLERTPGTSPMNWLAVPGDVTTTSNIASKLDSLTPSNQLYRVRVMP